MNEFMIEVNFNSIIPEGSLPLIQKQKEYIDEMFDRRVISDYSVSPDKKTLWVTFTVNTQKEAALLMEGFPLIDFIEYHFKPGRLN